MLEVKRNINLIMRDMPGIQMQIPIEYPKKERRGSTTAKKEISISSSSMTIDKKVEETKNSELNWTEKEVESWMKELNVNTTIRESLIPCDGQVLHQIFLMLKTNPEFFYSSMRNSGLNSLKDLKDVAFFSTQLTKLFEK